jgi:hypothetical protein
MMACSAAIWIGLALRRDWTTACLVAWAGAKIQELKDPALFNWLSRRCPNHSGRVNGYALVEPSGGAFQLREDELVRRSMAPLHRTP